MKQKQKAKNKYGILKGKTKRKQGEKKKKKQNKKQRRMLKTSLLDPLKLQENCPLGPFYKTKEQEHTRRKQKHPK